MADWMVRQGRGKKKELVSITIALRNRNRQEERLELLYGALATAKGVTTALWSAMGKNDGAWWITAMRGEASGSGRGVRAGRRFTQGLSDGGAVEAVNFAGERSSTSGVKQRKGGRRRWLIRA
jgi:hypothetical protein